MEYVVYVLVIWVSAIDVADCHVSIDSIHSVYIVSFLTVRCVITTDVYTITKYLIFLNLSLKFARFLGAFLLLFFLFFLYVADD
jgi:hypothetical protein